jgi:hypothetical protein
VCWRDKAKIFQKAHFTTLTAPRATATTLTMWKLSARDNEIRQWAELGEFQRIRDAAQRVLELEGSSGAVFFRVYVDPIIGEKSDAEILSRLEFQGWKIFYVLQRAMQ